MYQNMWANDCGPPGLGLDSVPPLPPIGQLPPPGTGVSGGGPANPPNNSSSPPSMPAPPPPPPRPAQLAQQPTRQNFPYQGFSGYRNYGSVYPRYGAYPGSSVFPDFPASISNFPLNQQNPPNRFVELALESSLPAFQTIQSVVQTFGSVSMMLESTFHAVHSSFQAVLAVVEQFSKMKLCLSQIFSAFAALRFLKYLYKKLLFLSGLMKSNPGFAECVWEENSLRATRLGELDVKGPVKWPLAVYVGLVCAAPYLAWKLSTQLNNLDNKALEDNGEWQRKIGEHYLATALHDFTSDNKQELNFNKGWNLVLAPRHLQPRVRGWLLASDGVLTGLVPANYINIVAKSEGKTQAKSEGKTQAKSEGKILAKSEGKTLAKSEGKTLAKSEGKTLAKSEGKPDIVASAANLAQEFKSEV